jgi:hypothetical protein
MSHAFGCKQIGADGTLKSSPSASSSSSSSVDGGFSDSLGFDPRSLAIEMEIERQQRIKDQQHNNDNNDNNDDIQSPEEYDFFKKTDL